MTCDFPFPNSGAMSKPAWTNLQNSSTHKSQNVVPQQFTNSNKKGFIVGNFRKWQKNEKLKKKETHVTLESDHVSCYISSTFFFLSKAV